MNANDVYYSGNLEARRALAVRQMTEVKSLRLTPFSLFQLGLFRTQVADDKRWVSMVDVMAVFSDSQDTEPRRYWQHIKQSLKRTGSELTPKVRQLKMPSDDGKWYKTDCMTEDDVIRVIWKLDTSLAEEFSERCVKWMRGVARVLTDGDLERMALIYKSEDWEGILARK